MQDKIQFIPEEDLKVTPVPFAALSQTQNWGMALANIQTSIIGSNLPEDNIIKLSGKIVENEETNSVQVSYFSGRIERLNVSFAGEKISKGQLLASVYSPELYAALPAPAIVVQLLIVDVNSPFVNSSFGTSLNVSQSIFL